MTTVRDVAEWMVEELSRVQYLYQEDVVCDIERKFGEHFICTNDRGNLAIDRGVLGEFRKLTGNDVVWNRTDRIWRKREDYDEPGRTQLD